MANEFTKIANLSDVPKGTVKVFELHGEQIAVCNADGTIYAVADLCSHDNGPLDQGTLEGCQIECPRHGARFDIKTGEALCLPAVMPIPTYKVEQRGQEIWVGPKK